jgi:hypothetical protein
MDEKKLHVFACMFSGTTGKKPSPEVVAEICDLLERRGLRVKESRIHSHAACEHIRKEETERIQ